MDIKKFRKTCGRFFGWLAFKVSFLIMKFLPGSFLYGFADALARVGLLVAFKQKRIARESLSIAFGKEKSPEELRKIAEDCFTFIARSAVETLYFRERPQLLKKRIILENMHVLVEALSRKKGAILVSGHFGNFPLMMLRLAIEGYPTGGIMRPMRDQRMDKVFTNLRDSLGIKTIPSQPRKACVEATIKALRDNEIIFIQLDQNFGSGAGVFVDFLGRRAATATGPLVFARRTKAAVIPCFIVRQKDNSHRIIFEPEFNLQEEKTPGETTLVNIQRLTGIIESYVRRYPAEWGWIHRRWKTRPQEHGIKN